MSAPFVPRLDWKDTPDESTPVYAADLKRIETGISVADTTGRQNASDITNLGTALTAEQQARLDQHTADLGTYAPLADLRAFGIFTPENYAAPAFGTDASTAIQAALNAAAAYNNGAGGTVRLTRQYSAQRLTWPSNVFIEANTGSGSISGLDPNLALQGPLIQLIAGANTDLMKSAWFDALNTGTTLNGSIIAGATSIILTSAASFPTAPITGAALMTVTIEGDVVTYTGVTANTLTGCTGVTTGHASGVTVKLQSNAYQTPRNLASRGLTLDGNKTLNSSGRCLALFTIDHNMDNITVQNSYGDCVYSAMGATAGEAARWSNFRIWGAGLFTYFTSSQALNSGTLNVASTAGFAAAGSLNVAGVQIAYTGTTSTSFTGCTGGNSNVLPSGASSWVAPWGVYSNGLNFLGPNDSQFSNGAVYSCTGSGIVEGPLGGNLSFANVHSWGNGAYNWDFQCGTASHVNCQSDGICKFTGVTARLNASLVTWKGGSIYGVANTPGQTLLQIGQGDGTASAVTGCEFDTTWFGLKAPSMPLLYADSTNLALSHNRFTGRCNQSLNLNTAMVAYGSVGFTLGSQTIGGGTTTLVMTAPIVRMPASGKLYVTNGATGGQTVTYSSFAGSTYTLTSPPSVTIPAGSAIWNTTQYGPGPFGNETWELASADTSTSYNIQYGDNSGHPQVVDGRPYRFSAATTVLNHSPTSQTLASAGTVAFSTSTGDIQIVTLQANMTASTVTIFAGQIVTFVVIQAAPGGFTYVWPPTFKFASSTGPSDTTSGRRSSVTMYCDGTNWLEIGRAVAVG